MGNYYKQIESNSMEKDIYENDSYKLTLTRDNIGNCDVEVDCYTQDMNQMRQH